MIQCLATMKPPEFVEIDGTEYPVNFHYLAWIEILDLLDEIDFDNLEDDLDIVAEIETLAFGNILNENVYFVLAAVTEFAAGYPKPPNDRAPSPSSSRRIVDFSLDLNSILIAIRDQSGIDLIESDDLFHWWRFLVEFENLRGEHHISKIMELRAYDGDDKAMKKARDAVALPRKVTRKDQRFEDEMADLFYNC